VTAPETTRSSARWLPRGLLPYATAAVVARSATEAIAPAVLLVAVATGLTAAQGALLLSCYVATGALSGPFVGALLDRTLRPKRSLSLALGGFAAALTGLAVGSGRLPFWTLAGIAAIAGLGQPAPTSGWTAQLPRVVSGHALSGAYGIDAATYSVGMIAGPGLAGIAFVLGKREPLLVPVALLCAAIVVLAFVQIAAVDAATLPVKANLRRGFTVVLRRPQLLRASVVSTIGFAGQASLIAVAPDISRQLTGGLSAVGPIFVAFAVGGLVSSLYLSRRPTIQIIGSTSAPGLLHSAWCCWPWQIRCRSRWVRPSCSGSGTAPCSPAHCGFAPGKRRSMFAARCSQRPPASASVPTP
jgi:MFS family permease